MKRIIVLGSNGQLGSDICKICKECYIIPLTRQDFDIETDSIDKIKQFNNIDIIINTTSFTKVDDCEDNPHKSFKINSSFVYELARFCYLNNILLFHVSTDYVFSGDKNTPYLETDIPKPKNIYGLSKYAGELAVQQYAQKYFIFRVSSLFGEKGVSGKGGNFIETMLNLAKKRIPLKVISDQFMAPTHTLDVAKAMLKFIKLNIKHYGIYHCCNSGYCSWHEFTTKIFELVKIDHPVIKEAYDNYPTKAKRPKYSVLDNRKLNNIYKMPAWQDALTEYLQIKNYIQ